MVKIQEQKKSLFFFFEFSRNIDNKMGCYIYSILLFIYLHHVKQQAFVELDVDVDDVVENVVEIRLERKHV